MNELDAIERINELLRAEGITRDELSTRTGIGYNRWLSVIQRKTQLRHSEIQAIAKVWPEYKLWIAYGEEMPEAGQISPMTKKAQEKLGTQGKAG